MKFAVLAALAMTILGFSGQSFASIQECSDRITLNVQGQELVVLVGPVTQPIKAKLNGKAVSAFVRSNNQIMVAIPNDQIPRLDGDQVTSYDARVDHHTIHEF